MPPTAIEREGCEPRLSKNVADPRGVNVSLLDQGPESRNARSLLWWWTVQGSAGASKHTGWAMRESWQAEYPAQGCELAHPNICLVFQQLEQEKGTHLQIHNQRIKDIKQWPGSSGSPLLMVWQRTETWNQMNDSRQTTLPNEGGRRKGRNCTTALQWNSSPSISLSPHLSWFVLLVCFDLEVFF